MTQSPPAGWYADPSGDARQRWWDGTVWTEHLTEEAAVSHSPPGFVAKPAATRPTKAPRAGDPPMFWVAIAGVGATAVGAVGPWVNFLGVQVSGAVGGAGDGTLLVAGAAVILCLLVVHSRTGPGPASIAAAVVSAVCATLSIYDVVRIERVTSGISAVSVGWGLWLACGGAVTATVATFVLQRRK
jgi:Protein of unknown function (DUF2510)